MADYNDFAARTTLESVNLVSISAHRNANGDLADARFDFQTDYAIETSRLFFRLQCKAEVRDVEDVILAPIEAAIAAVFPFEGESPSQDVAVRFCVTNGVLVTFPYLRETLTSMAARFGFSGLMIPLMGIRPDVITPSDR